MIRIKSVVIILSFLLMTKVSLFSQENDALRVEIEAKTSSEKYNVVPMGEKGVLLFYESDEKDKSGNTIWEFTKYDTRFKEVWTKNFPVIKELNFIDYYYPGDNNLYLLVAKSPDSKGNYQVIDLNVTDGNIKSTNGKITMDASINELKVIGNNAYLIGTTLPSQGQACGQACFTYTCIPLITGKVLYKTNVILLNLNLATGISSIVKNNYEGNTFIIGTEVNAKENILTVLLKNIPNKKESYLYRNKYDVQGELISSIKLESKEDKEINSGRTMTINKNSEIMIGTYLTVNPKKRKNMNSAGSNSNGMFFASFEKEEQQYIKYYDFSKFSTFYTHFKTRLFSSNETKIRKGEKTISYRLLVHDIIKRDNDYVMVAEAYYPQYHTEYRTSYRNGQMVSYTVEVFDGYKYTHAIIAGFDFEGNLLWDNTFEIGDVVSYTLKERVKVLPYDEEIVLLYSWSGNIISTIIKGNEIVGDKEMTKIESKNADDNVKRNYDSDVSYWYDNYFISYGYQTLISEEEKKSGGKKKRTIFYFNKIGYSQ